MTRRPLRACSAFGSFLKNLSLTSKLPKMIYYLLLWPQMWLQGKKFLACLVLGSPSLDRKTRGDHPFCIKICCLWWGKLFCHEGNTWKLRLTEAESSELDDHGILLPARLTQEVLAVPAKPSPSFFGKLLQGLNRCWTFLQISPLDFMVHPQRHNGSLPKGQVKWTRMCL